MLRYFLLIAAAAACTDVCTVKEELGTSTWRLLHAMVEHVEATPANEQRFQSLIRSLEHLYPCEECREHISEYISNRRVEMTEKFMCDFHNSVNIRLNKPIYDC